MLDRGGEVGVLEGVDASGEGVGGVVGQDGTGELRQDASAVYLLVNQMNGDATLGVAIGKHLFMHVVTIHSRSTVAWQQRGVDIDNAVLECGEHGLANHREKSRQHHQVDVKVLEVLSNLRGVEPMLLAEVFHLDAQRAKTISRYRSSPARKYTPSAIQNHLIGRPAAKCRISRIHTGTENSSESTRRMKKNSSP